MREDKFNFPHKTVDPTNTQSLRAALKKEAMFSPANHVLLSNYFFMREFLQQMAAEEKGLIIDGSTSYPMHAKPYRIPTDMDLKSTSPNRVLELIRHIADSERDATYTVGGVAVTSNNVAQTSIEADLHGFRGRFNIDIVPDESFSSQILTMKKIVSTDVLFDMRTVGFDETIANKIESILNKLNSPQNPYFRIKDFYDIFMLCQGNEPNRQLISAYLNEMIARKGSSRDALKRTQANLSGIVAPTQNAMWEAFKKKNEVAPEIEVAEVVRHTKNLIDEIELK